MTTTNTTNDCSRLRDDLASLADDEPAAVDAHADHLAECDECRDARHEARTIARALATAGDEFEETDDFHARLMRAVDVGLAADHAGGTPSRSARPTPTRRPAISDERRRAAPVERRAGAPAASTRSSRRLATVALACAAVLACAAIGVRQLWMARSTSSTTAPSAATPPLSGRLQTIARSGDEPGVTGMTLRSADGASPTAATAGDAVPAGATVRTDARTRARLTLSDGSTLVLDHDTEVALDARAPRGVRLEHGAIVADVTHLPDGPRASFSTPQGRIEVLGTKFVLTAADSRTNVEVVRGAIRLAPLAGRDGWAQVQAGQEGIVGQDGKPRVMPATHLASAVEWAELDTPGEAEPNGSSGLGVLRARRPGETGSREHPLSLSSHRVSVRIAGTVARTEIEERFANDGAHVLEGTYEFPLPADARIVRLALDVEGRLVDGAIVERDRATKIWAGVLRHATPVAARARKEEFVWVPGPWRDPALLEWRSGGRFGLRIFPIPAHGERRIVLTYEQVIAPRGDTRRYVYPLPHPVGAQPRAAHFEMDARVAGIDPSVPVTARGYEARVSRDGDATRVRFAEENFIPAGDFVVDWALPDRAAEMRAWTYARDDRAWALLALRPTLPAWTEARRADLSIVVDSSQSMFGERFIRASELAAEVIAELDRRDHFVVLACDVRCQAMPGGAQAPSVEAAASARAWLATVRPAGASDLGATLRTAAHAIDGADAVRVVYIGDGTATVGHRRASALEAEVAALTPGASVTTVGVGGEADEAVLSALARAGGGQFVAYRPTDSLSSAALAVIETTIGPSLQDARLELPDGLLEVAPARLPTIRAGDEVVIAARLAGPVQGEAVLRGRVGGAAFERRYPLSLEPAASAGNAFVPAVWADRRISDLDRQDAPNAVERIVALSKEYGVVSRHTSLLVLESEAMFRAFGVDHAAPVASWNGEDEPVATEARGAEQGLASSQPANERSRGHRSGARRSENLDSLLGQAIGGSSVRGMVAPGRLQHAAAASGSLDRSGIQRVVRARAGDLRAAYERSLRSNPNASGRVTATWTIAPNGTVSSVQVRGGDGIDTAALAAVIRRWRFPAPEGGSITVSYPFIFQSAGGGAPAGRERPATNAPAAPDPAPAPSADAAPRETPVPAGRTTVDLGAVRGRPGAGAGRWMRRTWRRESTVRADGAARPAELAAVERAEASLAELPDSRDRHERLVRALSRAGQVDRALEVAQKWLGRDPLDPDAILALSDALARKGRRDEALRMLSGVVDVQPEDRSLHERLAGAYERIGDAEHACAHRITIAEIVPADAAAVGDAVRCEKTAGREASAERLLTRIGDPALLSRVQTEAAKALEVPRVSGDVTIEATWNGDEDLDVALVTAAGARLSWMGGRKTVVTDDAGQSGHERLGLRFAPAGSYLVEIARTSTARDGPVRGRLAIGALGSRRTVDFVLDGEHQTVARIDITRREVLVPAN